MGNQGGEKINALEGCQTEGEKELEEKMDKFYALIRDFRDARDHRRNELLKEMEINSNKQHQQHQQQSQMMMMKKRKAVEQQTASSLIPSFSMEDFALQRPESKRTSLKCPCPCPAPSTIKIQIHQPDDDLDEDSGLDLKLAL